MPTYDNLSKPSRFFNAKWCGKLVGDLQLAGEGKRTVNNHRAIDVW